MIALGGNALLRRGQPMTIENQRATIATACQALAGITPGNEVIITHGNGPQVGLLALQADAYDTASRYPFDVLGAQTEGMIGYLIGQELGNHLRHRRTIVTLITRTLVDQADPAFAEPTKPVGPVYPAEVASELATRHGWTIRPDGEGFRRVVPSPPPRSVLELEPIRWILDHGAIVICAGGGGIPVVRDDRSGRLSGVEAVIDKDLTSAVLATDLDADRLIIATDVPGVIDGWGTPQARLISRAMPAALAGRRFAAGSMQPKIDAALSYVASGLGDAVIGHVAEIDRMLDGTAGTTISAAANGMTWKRPQPCSNTWEES